MNAFKLLTYLIIIFITTVSFTQCASAKSRCKIETLRNVCQICEERALSKLDTDSVCPEVKCPEVSKNCTELNSFDHI